MTLDEVWFRGLFGDNYQHLLAYAVRRMASVDDAKDVVADVFAVTWRRRAALPDDPTEQRMWLYGVARRTLANHHRSQRRQTRLVTRLTGLSDEVVPDPATADDSSDLAAAMEALRSLRTDDREILLLFLWEELTPTQIAMVMGISPSNVSLRLHRAKARLRREFLRQVKDRSVGGHVVDRRAQGEVAQETSP